MIFLPVSLTLCARDLLAGNCRRIGWHVVLPIPPGIADMMEMECLS